MVFIDIENTDDTGLRCATENIPCYKVVLCNFNPEIPSCFISPYMKHPFDIGKTYHTSIHEDPVRARPDEYDDDMNKRIQQLNMEIKAIRDFRNIIRKYSNRDDVYERYVTRGFHTYKTLLAAENERFVSGLPGIILECVIPKGSWYYSGMFLKSPLYLSETLKTIDYAKR